MTNQLPEEIDIKMKNHRNYNMWKSEAINFGYIEDFIPTYIRWQYLKSNLRDDLYNNCSNPAHKPNIDNLHLALKKPMKHVCILEEDFLQFYDKDKNYFQKLVKCKIKKYYKKKLLQDFEKEFEESRYEFDAESKPLICEEIENSFLNMEEKLKSDMLAISNKLTHLVNIQSEYYNHFN